MPWIGGPDAVLEMPVSRQLEVLHYELIREAQEMEVLEILRCAAAGVAMRGM